MFIYENVYIYPKRKKTVVEEKSNGPIFQTKATSRQLISSSLAQSQNEVIANTNGQYKG